MLTNNMSKFNAWSSSDYDDEEDNSRPVRMRIQRKGVGIIDVEYSEDEMTMYCPHCKEYGFRCKLGPKILMPGEQRQPDYENWLQCTSCYEVVAAFVVEDDATIIRDDIPTVETPFENTTKIMGANPKRSSPAGKNAARGRKRKKTILHEDPEINELMRIYGDRVNVVYDTNP